jgi:hypothetical protein
MRVMWFLTVFSAISSLHAMKLARLPSAEVGAADEPAMLDAEREAIAAAADDDGRSRRPSRGCLCETFMGRRHAGGMSLLTKITRLARTPQGRKLTDKAVRYARSPEGRRAVEKARTQLARGKRRD